MLSRIRDFQESKDLHHVLPFLHLNSLSLIKCLSFGLNTLNYRIFKRLSNSASGNQKNYSVKATNTSLPTLWLHILSAFTTQCLDIWKLVTTARILHSQSILVALSPVPVITLLLPNIKGIKVRFLPTGLVFSTPWTATFSLCLSNFAIVKTLGWEWQKWTHRKEKNLWFREEGISQKPRKGWPADHSKGRDSDGVHEWKQDHGKAPHPMSAECSSVFLTLLSPMLVSFSLFLRQKHTTELSFPEQILKCRLKLLFSYEGTLILGCTLCSGVCRCQYPMQPNGQIKVKKREDGCDKMNNGPQRHPGSNLWKLNITYVAKVTLKMWLS